MPCITTSVQTPHAPQPHAGGMNPRPGSCSYSPRTRWASGPQRPLGAGLRAQSSQDGRVHPGHGLPVTSCALPKGRSLPKCPALPVPRCQDLLVRCSGHGHIMWVRVHGQAHPAPPPLRGTGRGGSSEMSPTSTRLTARRALGCRWLPRGQGLYSPGRGRAALSPSLGNRVSEFGTRIPSCARRHLSF